jgi:hypothetical protein
MTALAPAKASKRAKLSTHTLPDFARDDASCPLTLCTMPVLTPPALS